MKLLFTLLLSFGFLLSFSQDSLPTVLIKKYNTNYKDFGILDDNVFAITKGDSLIKWNIKTDKINLVKENVNSIEITVDEKVIITTVNKKLLTKTKDSKHWKNAGYYDGELFDLLLTKDNRTVIITSLGFYFDGEKLPAKLCRIYKPIDKENLNELFLNKPTLSYIDNNDRIWLTYDEGEWGTDTWFYDLKVKRLFQEAYLDLDVNYSMFQNWKKYQTDIIKAFPNEIKITLKDTLYKFPYEIPIYHGVKGIAEDDEGNIYLSQSLQHFFLSGGLSIYSETKYENFYSSKHFEKFLKHDAKPIEVNNKKSIWRNYNEYLGPVTFNKYNKSIYYFSNYGFFKIKTENNIIEKKNIFTPTLLWKGGLSHSVGYQMAVKKFEFKDSNTFVFLTNMNGIGYFDGKTVKYLK